MARWRLLVLVAVAAAIIGIALQLARHTVPPSVPPLPPSTATDSATPQQPAPRSLTATDDPARFRAAESLPDGIRLLPESRDLTASLHQPQESPEHDLEVVENLLALYRQIFGRNPPGGDNREIVAAMLGANPGKLAIIPPETASLSPEGDLLDRWGTPFYFHPVSEQVMEVMSAGPDKALWTPDDVGKIEPAGAVSAPGS